MAITEAYMDAGDFSVPMRIETPHLMETVQRGGYLTITPQYLGDPRGYTLASLHAAGSYTGIVTETIWTNGILTLEGSGLDWLLGDLSEVGSPINTVTFSSDSLTDVIALQSAGGIIPPIFSIGTVSNTGAGVFSGSYVGYSETVKQVIAAAMAKMVAHYKIRPDGTIDAGGVSTETPYKNTPTVVATVDGWGSDALWTGIPILDASSSDSIREWNDDYEPELFNLGGSALVQRHNVGSLPALEQPAGAAIEANELVTSWTRLAESGAGVGDTIYVYAPGSGFAGSALVWFRGQALNPAKHRLVEVEWEPVEGMGFYYTPPISGVDIDDVVDLTATVATVSPGEARSYLRTLELSDESQPST